MRHPSDWLIIFYDKNSWPNCISWYNRVDRFKLTSAELSEYHFKKGYAYYMRKDYESARVEFYEILDVESSYNAPATYYYSHIHYEDKNYETALMGFRAIDDDPLFSDIAPYYISQILFMQKKYAEVIDYAPNFMDSVSEKRLGEMAKIIGESYFMLEQYKEAIPLPGDLPGQYRNIYHPRPLPAGLCILSQPGV